jgi:hypothetical protein
MQLLCLRDRRNLPTPTLPPANPLPHNATLVIVKPSLLGSMKECKQACWEVLHLVPRYHGLRHKTSAGRSQPQPLEHSNAHAVHDNPHSADHPPRYCPARLPPSAGA